MTWTVTEILSVPKSGPWVSDSTGVKTNPSGFEPFHGKINRLMIICAEGGKPAKHQTYKKSGYPLNQIAQRSKAMASKPIISLCLVVDRSSNKVVFAESSSHFVGILLSFLTLPLGSILRLTSKQPLGSIHRLYESVESLDKQFVSSDACRSMLLQPIYSLAVEKPDYYICSKHPCTHERLSFYAKTYCRCGSLMDKKVRLVPVAEPAVFIESCSRFMISDDLAVSAPSTEETIELIAKLRIEQGSVLEAMHVDVTAAQIFELLKRFLVSDTPLTDMFLAKQTVKDKMQINQQSIPQKCNKIKQPTTSERISVKLFLKKDDNKVLYAEADNNFADLLASFLTYPLGSVANKLGGRSGIGCLDNLYNSIEALESSNFFRENGHKEMLLSPKLPPYCKLEKQLISLDEEIATQRYYMCRTHDCDSDEVSTVANAQCNGCGKITNMRLSLTDPKYSPSDDNGKGGYFRNSRYMVTDDLVLKPLSYVMVATDFLKEAGSGILAKNVEIGVDEALALLQASIISEKVLTDVLVRNKLEGKRRMRQY